MRLGKWGRAPCSLFPCMAAIMESSWDSLWRLCRYSHMFRTPLTPSHSGPFPCPLRLAAHMAANPGAPEQVHITQMLRPLARAIDAGMER